MGSHSRVVIHKLCIVWGLCYVYIHAMLASQSHSISQLLCASWAVVIPSFKFCKNVLIMVEVLKICINNEYINIFDIVFTARPFCNNISKF